MEPENTSLNGFNTCKINAHYARWQIAVPIVLDEVETVRAIPFFKLFPMASLKSPALIGSLILILLIVSLPDKFPLQMLNYQNS